jgi:NhaP-type Na+/H+ or K+/H+ antiporter
MSLHKGNFFRNLGSIVTFAVVGTLISTLFVGLLLFATTAIGASSPDMSLLECLIFGALISAVDPVATLAIFHALEVDPTLYMLVFGESVLNDGVSIVLFRTFVSFVGLEGAGSPVVTVIKAIGLFLFTTFASVSIGVLSGAGTALLFKHTRLGDYPSLELALYLIMSYLPYLLAEALSLSGIMAILFCGIVNAHYTHFNLTPATQSTTQQCFRMFAFAAEALIFAYLGLAIFTFDHSFHWGLVLWGMLGILAGRALNIYPLSAAVNRFRYVPIPRQDQFIMWFSGLRGAIAFALALNAPTGNRSSMVTATLVIVMVTIFVFGGGTMPLLKLMGARKERAAASNRAEAALASSSSSASRRRGESDGEPLILSPHGPPAPTPDDVEGGAAGAMASMSLSSSATSSSSSSSSSSLSAAPASAAAAARRGNGEEPLELTMSKTAEIGSLVTAEDLELRGVEGFRKRRVRVGWFEAADDKWLRPFFVREAVPADEEEGLRALELADSRSQAARGITNNASGFD